MATTEKKFRSDTGFETSGFNVATGLMDVNTINTSVLKVNNVEVMRASGAGFVVDFGSGGALSVAGAVINGDLTVSGASTYLSVINGVISLSSRSGAPGVINNMIIGQSGPASGTFTTLTATTGTITTLGTTTLTATNLTTTGLTTSTLTTTGLTTSTLTASTSITTGTISATSGTITTLGTTSITANNVTINNLPTLATHATRKDYVDATATALAIALGA